MLKDIQERLLAAAERNIPFYVPGKFYPNPFWSLLCEHARRHRERLYRQYKRTGRLEVKILWKRARAICKKTFKIAKEESFKNYVNELNRNVFMSTVYGKLRQLRGRPPRRIKFLSDKCTTFTTLSDLANCLASSFANISNYDNHPAIFKQNRMVYEQESLILPNRIRISQ